MWLYKLRKIKLLVLFCYSGKLSHRSSGWQVPLLFPYCQAAKPLWQMVLRCPATCHGWEEPTANPDPNPCLAIPTSAWCLILPITVLTTAFHSITPWRDFTWDLLFHKIIQEQDGYMYINIRKKNPQWFSNISISSLITFFLICLCASNFQQGYWKVWAGFQCVLIVDWKIGLRCLFLDTFLSLRKDFIFLFHSKSFHTTQGHTRQG